MTSPALRGGLWFLALVELAVGVVATVSPRGFYHYVPWVDLLPPYSEHLMRDVGALSLSLALVLVVAAVTMERRMVQVGLGAYLVFAVLHFLFHTTHLENFTTAAAVGQTAILGVGVLLPAGLLLLTGRRGSH
ncbi:hypothetical protein H7I01_09055 [Mycobacterium palustre]|uniref:DoxX family protein n=1 Tax=Mycobacterium palustre TaxID=153971 RepID=A0A1X1ZWM8_9MYCO|nr:hypothetical protein [Mycobacterium palustre]ORW28631.1 hypothetical protein AWC19_26980 [Mycobacterium palustre]